jgi:hypothetical protein
MEVTFDQFIISLFSGILGGGLISPLLANNLNKKRILGEQKSQILKDLMATRFNSPNDQRAAEAINFIPVLFAMEKNVLTAYANYHSATLNNSSDLANRFNELIVEIAKNIGINLHPADLMKTPIFSKKTVLLDNQCNAEFEEFLKTISNSSGIKNAKTND